MRVCYACLGKRKARRDAAYDQAVSEIGPLTAQTHKQIVARIKELEKQAAE
jgi:hypothetical protein